MVLISFKVADGLAGAIIKAAYGGYGIEFHPNWRVYHHVWCHRCTDRGSLCSCAAEVFFSGTVSDHIFPVENPESRSLMPLLHMHMTSRFRLHRYGYMP